MKTTATTLAFLTLALSLGCGGETPPPPILDRAIDAMGGRDALAGVKTVYLKLKGEFVPAQGAVRTPYSAEHLVTLPDGYAIRVNFGGLVTYRGLAGGKAWMRSGAAVADLTGDQVGAEETDRDDYLALLLVPALDRGFRAEAGDAPNRLRLVSPAGVVRTIDFHEKTGLPSRMERGAMGKSGANPIVRTFEGWVKCGRILLPSRIRGEGGGSRLELTVTDSAVNRADHGGVSTVRPRDTGKPKTGPIRQIRTKGGNFLTVEHRGPLTDLAKVDHLIERALTISKAGRRGPNRRVFRKFADASGEALVLTILPVTLSRDRDAGDLPRGVAVQTLEGSDALAMEFTGPYPTDRSLTDMLENYGMDLGLVATAPAQFVILSDPDEGEPAELRQEIRVPVRKAE